MHFDLIQSLGLAGDAARANDDRAGSGDRLAWVIDGATDLGPPGLMGTRGGAAWLALTADAAFAAAPGASLSQVVAHVFDRVGEAFVAERTREAAGVWEHPSAAFLAAALDGEALDVAWLADCVGLLLSDESIVRLGPQPTVAETEAAREAGASGIALAAKTRDPALTDRLRAQRNRPERRVLGVDPMGATQVRYARVPVRAGDDIVLMSDGFAALIDDYGMTAAEFRDRLHADGLPGLAATLRATERDDAACARFPRFKVSDDATALWLRVSR